MRDYTYERQVPTAASRKARKAIKEADVKVAMAEYERTQKAFHANHERLRRSDWLARDAEAARKLKS